MDSYLLKNKIDHFWQWFVKHESQFREISDPEAVRELLNNQVLQFGIFSWEIGEGQTKPHSFIISPNGNPKMLRRSEAIIGEAPDLPDWEFFAAKPAAADWDFTFKMFDSKMLPQTIQVGGWKYVLRIVDDEELSVLIYAENIDFLDEDDKSSAADFVLNQTIGEMNKIYYVDAVSFIEVLDKNYQDDLKPWSGFKTEFEKIVDGW